MVCFIPHSNAFFCIVLAIFNKEENAHLSFGELMGSFYLLVVSGDVWGDVNLILCQQLLSTTNNREKGTTHKH